MRCLLATLPILVITSACAHGTEVPSTEPGTKVYVTTAQYPDGAVRTVTVERVRETPGSCDQVVVQTHDFDPLGAVVERTLESRRCQVTELRLVERPEASHYNVQVFHDTDHDGVFDTEASSQRDRPTLTAVFPTKRQWAAR